MAKRGINTTEAMSEQAPNLSTCEVCLEFHYMFHGRVFTQHCTILVRCKPHCMVTDR